MKEIEIEEKAVTIIDPPEERVMTPRERQILKLVMESHSMADVAKKLHIGSLNSCFYIRIYYLYPYIIRNPE